MTDLFEELEPLPDDSPLCPIGGLNLSESFSDTISNFRRVLYDEEVSHRAFSLTEEVIQISSSFYQAWHYRKFLFFRLELDLEPELDFLLKVALENPKNYQMWHYRKDLLRFCRNPGKELEFVANILSLDDRNVHAWGFRLWVVEMFDLWEEDLLFIEDYLRNNSRNNSAWNYRHFVFKQCDPLRHDDLGFVFEFVEDLLNESCFNYIASLCKLDNCHRIKAKMILVAKEIGINVGLLRVLLKCFKLTGKPILAQWCCFKIMEIDEVRKEYWNHRAKEEFAISQDLDESDLEFCNYFEISF